MPATIDLSEFDPYAPTSTNQTSSTTSDPLSSFSKLRLSDDQPQPSTDTPNPIVQQHEHRHSQFLQDHSHPYSPPLSSTSSLSQPPIPSTSTQVHPIRSPPPRRLSSLMDLNPSSTSSTSPPSSSFLQLDPFHPFPTSRSREKSTTDYWGEFQTATPSPSSTPPPPSSSCSKPPTPHRASTTPNPHPHSRLHPLARSSLEDYHLKHLPPPPSATPSSSSFDPFNQPLKLLGIRKGTSQILTETMAESIRPNLPPRLKISTKWHLLYSLDQHGTSLHSLFDCVSTGLKERSSGGFLLVIKTEKGRVFGGYVSEAFKNDESGVSYRSGGRSVVTGNRVWGGDGSS